MTEAPDPPTPAWLLAQLDRAGISQRAAARLLHVDERTMRRWCAGDSPMTWTAAELLRRLLDRARP